MNNNKKNIQIDDDLNLAIIADSGQAFRIKLLKNGYYEFITGAEILYIKPGDGDIFNISCTDEKWNDVWKPYFDFGRNYSAIRAEAKGKLKFIDEAMDFGKGIRILKQDAFEMLITFIISQRKSIPAITTSVQRLCERFGEVIEDHTGLSEGTVYAFPTPEALAAAGEKELSECGLGYRMPYVSGAARAVAEGSIDLGALYELSDEELFEKLLSIRGVGKKVANCICLFAYARVGMVPIDVWIARAIENECGGKSPFELYGENAGIIQQYVFYYERMRIKIL